MKLPTLLTLLLPLAGLAETTYEFKPYTQKTGETLRMDHTLGTKEGVLIRERNGAKERGTITRNRIRHLERRVTEKDDSPQVEYKTITDISTTANSLERGGGHQSRIGSLSGQTVLGTQDPAGHWKLTLKGKPANEVQRTELAELEAYENRDWFPDHPVKVGESWEFNPAYIRHLMVRDLGTVEVKATMMLQEIKEIDGEATAIFKTNIQSVGAKGDGEVSAPGATEATGALNATGTLHVALATMLDTKLTLSGTLNSTSLVDGLMSSMSLPMTVEITKGVVKASKDGGS